MAIFNKKSKAYQTTKASNVHKNPGFSGRALVPVLPASVLLTHTKRAQLVDDIARYTRLPRKLFDELYRHAINEYASFTQRLHAVKGAKYDVLGGALELGLQRAHDSMEQYQRYLKDNTIYPESLSMQQELWNYVLFSASLVYDCGRIAEFFQVKLYDDARDEVGDWLPVQGNMITQGAYYFAEKRMGTLGEYLPQLTVMIAERLLPEKGLEWISSQRAALEMWLQLLGSDLDEEEGSRSLFMSLILWVNNNLMAGDVPGGGTPKPTRQYKMPMLNFGKQPGGARDSMRKPTLAGGALNAGQGPSAHLGAAGGAEFTGQFPNLGGEFVEWLRASLVSGAINMNTLASVMQGVREGMIFRGPQVYAQFLQAKGLSEQFTVGQVERAVAQLAITEPGLQGQSEVKVQVGNDPKNIEQWTLIPDAKNIFKETKIQEQPHFAVIAVARAVKQHKWYQQRVQEHSPTRLPNTNPTPPQTGGK